MRTTLDVVADHDTTVLADGDQLEDFLINLVANVDVEAGGEPSEWRHPRGRLLCPVPGQSPGNERSVTAGNGTCRRDVIMPTATSSS